MQQIACNGLLKKHFEELRQKYDGMIFSCKKRLVHGNLVFSADYEGKFASGNYGIKILVPEDYPETVPTVIETGGKIADDFHRNKPSGDLCLGAPFAVRQLWKESPNLLGFVEKLVIPFLFSHAYRTSYGKMPYGELAHGTDGILQYYYEYFRTNNRDEVVAFLKDMLPKSEPSFTGIVQKDIVTIEEELLKKRVQFKKMIQWVLFGGGIREAIKRLPPPKIDIPFRKHK